MNQTTEAKYRASHSLVIIEKQIKKEKIAAQNLPAGTKSPTLSCWERIRDQYQINPNYYSESRQDLDKVVGEWFYNPGSGLQPSHESSKEGKFFAALAKAGLMEGVLTQKNETESLQILSEISANDPDNSAPLVYMAIIYEGQGKTHEAESLMRRIETTKYFNSYMKDFTKQLFSHVRTPSDLLAAQEIWSTAPVPNAIKIGQILKKYQSQKLAMQMMRDGLDYENERLSDLSWIPLDYAVGRKALEAYGKAQGYPTESDLLKKKESRDLNPEKLVQKLSETCDLNSIEDDVSAVRKLIDQARK